MPGLIMFGAARPPPTLCIFFCWARAFCCWTLRRSTGVGWVLCLCMGQGWGWGSGLESYLWLATMGSRPDCGWEK